MSGEVSRVKKMKKSRDRAPFYARATLSLRPCGRRYLLVLLFIGYLIRAVHVFFTLYQGKGSKSD